MPGAAATIQDIAETAGTHARDVGKAFDPARFGCQCPQAWQHRHRPRLAAGVMVDALQLIETGDKIAFFQPVRFLADADQPGGVDGTATQQSKGKDAKSKSDRQ